MVFSKTVPKPSPKLISEKREWERRKEGRKERRKEGKKKTTAIYLLRDSSSHKLLSPAPAICRSREQFSVALSPLAFLGSWQNGTSVAPPCYIRHFLEPATPGADKAVRPKAFRLKCFLLIKGTLNPWFVHEREKFVSVFQMDSLPVVWLNIYVSFRKTLVLFSGRGFRNCLSARHLPDLF